MNIATVICLVEIELNMPSEHSWIGRFANGVTKSDDLQSSALRNISFRQKTRVSWIGEIIASLDGCFY